MKNLTELLEFMQNNELDTLDTQKTVIHNEKEYTLYVSIEANEEEEG